MAQLNLDAPPGLHLPASTSPLSPQPAVNIMITETAIVIEGDAVVRVKTAASIRCGSARVAAMRSRRSSTRYQAPRTPCQAVAHAESDGRERQRGIAIVMADRRRHTACSPGALFGGAGRVQQLPPSHAAAGAVAVAKLAVARRRPGS